ncbi:hypothetical protein [Paraburkholderia sp. UCT31]|uniref:hypothetical protein n=1 Tax=Paraburkholderia sp. UCT31 TaxID=2615209 RepID=UPI001655E059|nr:hypothetical protein [Paraburkholderia sp. UCT31]
MNVSSFSNRADTALRNRTIRREVRGLIEALESVSTTLWPGKSEKQAGKCILQPMLNCWIEQELVERGWTKEVAVTGVSETDGMRVDFCRKIGKRVILLEVQLGNVGRLYADFAKFQHAQMKGNLALAITVSLTAATAKLTDSGLSTHENTLTRVAEFNDTIFEAIPVPLLCLGLSHDPSNVVDLSKSRFPHPKILSGKGAKAEIASAVEKLRRGVPVEWVGPRENAAVMVASGRVAPRRAATRQTARRTHLKAA